ncbi:helix-turn-helix domain-containing protein [Actinomadura sp. WMMA1423]|uniref:helix-turn-helix domain-containing protein n=1 Tax=Actinomadura sp. WMMA1423 TaxID=2591108 RepID=UPI0011463297|nr:helix-turn-helix domain-containing protein [Actinomadura sp. WMMA1423]
MTPAPPVAACEESCPHLHTPEEASALLGGRTSPRTLRDKAGRGEIAHTRIAGTNRIAFSDADIAQIIRDGASGRPAPLRRDSRRHS